MTRYLFLMMAFILGGESLLAVDHCLGRKEYTLATNYQIIANRFEGNLQEMITVDSIDKILTFPALDYNNIRVQNGDGSYYEGPFVYRKRVRRYYGYKFAVGNDCQINVSPYVYEYRRDPVKGFHHHLLAAGQSCLAEWSYNPNTPARTNCSMAYTAGVIFFFHDGNEVQKVVLANRSTRFNNPVLESLYSARNILRSMGISKDKIILLDRPNL